MQGYQFAHMEVYSVKGAPGREIDKHVRKKNGARVWSASEILDEAERLHHASRHVKPGGPGPEILPCAADDIATLRAAHKRASRLKQSFDYTNKDGSKKKRSRSLRSDAASLYTCVVSLPVKTEEALSDPTLRAECLDLLKAAMREEEKRIKSAGGAMMLGVIHWDEDQVHAHFFALNETNGRVDKLHPGRAAKQSFIDANGSTIASKSKLNEAANRAYCNAMRDWQTDFHESVFKDAGLLRFGPKRERLTRTEYLRAKEAATSRAEDAHRQKLLREERAAFLEIQKSLGEISQMDAENVREWQEHTTAQHRANASWADELEVRSQAMEKLAEDVQAKADVIAGREGVLESREGAVVAREHALETREAHVEKREAEADGTIALIEAVAEGLVAFDDTGEGLKTRPTRATKQSPTWDGLLQRIKRAGPSLSGTAERVANHFGKIRSAAQAEGQQDAQRAAREELEGVRERMTSAIEAARRVAGIALSFAGKLTGADSAAMQKEIDAALRQTASYSTASAVFEKSAGRMRQARGGAPDGNEVGDS